MHHDCDKKANTMITNINNVKLSNRRNNIKGFTYTGHKGCYQGSETASIFLYGRLAMGKEVMVYYSINNPSFSTLNPAIGLVFYVPLILTVAFFSALIGIYVKGLSS